MPLVEVVGGAQTAPEIIERALAFYSVLGKRPIHVRREVKGHIANRLQAALWREAVHLVAEGVATVSDIDSAISEGPGIRWALMGPNLVFHLAGGGMKDMLDKYAGPFQDWWDDLGRPQLTSLVRQKLIDGVTAEVAGRGIKDLAAERDRLLLEILALKRERAT
jgi:3-hydroxyacyl-CoA dehydrogenase